MQTASNLHHHVRNALGGQAQDIFDDPTPFDPSDHVFDYHPHTGEDPVVERLSHRQRFALGLFLGCMVNTRSGS